MKDTEQTPATPKALVLRGLSGLRHWITRPLAAVGVCSALVACGAAPTDERVLAEVDGRMSTSIYGGAKDDDSESITSVVALRVGLGGTFELCTGTVIAPNVILTARHCVTKNVTTSVSCDEEGRSANGRHIVADEDPSTIGVYLGAAPSFAQKPVAAARAIVAPKSTVLCNADIALVVLDKNLPSVAPLPVRLYGSTQPGETIRSVGYGQNDKRLPIGTRLRKEGVAVLAQGKAVSKSRTPLGLREFEVGRSICQGDSGGPAISEQTGAVIGVVSRGGGCDDDFGHIYTTTAGFDDLFQEAFALAGGAVELEPGDAANASTRSHAGPTPNLENEPAPDAASCSVQGHRRGQARDVAGAALVAVALAAAARRRRRSV